MIISLNCLGSSINSAISVGDLREDVLAAGASHDLDLDMFVKGLLVRKDCVAALAVKFGECFLRRASLGTPTPRSQSVCFQAVLIFGM